MGDTPGLPFEDGNKHRWGGGARGGQYKSGPGGGGSPGAYVNRATTAGTRSQKQRPVGEVSASAARLVKSRTGIDITGKELRLDHNGLVHAWRNHGPNGKVQGAAAITKGDLVRAPKRLNDTLMTIQPSKQRGINGPRFEAGFSRGRRDYTIIYETSATAVYPMNMWRVR